ncbi:hypothetical protein HHI36_021659 [Cryptolaemus montrouzieri]|uniref:Uncharacterized protein n=1 Tax=Cryptolaemus montrouzieri TaxID=559131 RepID=A0ABD2MXK6_9CUCU
MSCRLCLKRSDGISFSSNDVLQTKIKECLAIDVNEHKELPNKICYACKDKLEEFLAFREFSYTANRILQNALKTNTLHIFLGNNKNIHKRDDDTQVCEQNNQCIKVDSDSDVGEIILEETSDLDCMLSEYESYKKVMTECKTESDEFDVERESFYQEEDTEQLEPYFICKLCEKEFTTKKEFTYHENICSWSPNKSNFKCYVCEDFYNTKEELIDHVKSHISNDLKAKHDIDTILNYDKKSKEHEQFEDKVKCPVCSKVMLEQSLKPHLIKHTDRFKCPNCPARSSSKANLWVHIKSFHTNIRDHVCHLCSKSFAHAALLKIHLKSHSNERLYKCNLCNYAGRTSSALRTHNHTHKTERPHLCDLCAKTFRTISELRIHMRRTHVGERKFKCKECSQSFFQRHKLNVHMRIHTGDKPYVCEVCNKKFRRSDALKEHIRTHEKVIHKCEECSKEFLSKKSFKMHICKLMPSISV